MSVRDARLEDAPQIGQIHVESWLTSYRGLMPDSLLDNLSVKQRTTMWTNALENENRQSMILVSEDDEGDVVGFASAGRNRDTESSFQGELYAIYFLESAQGKGLGKELFVEVVNRLIQREYNSMLLWVLGTNQASRGFYEHMGGELVGERQEEYEGVILPHVAYGWHDLRELINRHSTS